MSRPFPDFLYTFIGIIESTNNCQYVGKDSKVDKNEALCLCEFVSRGVSNSTYDRRFNSKQQKCVGEITLKSQQPPTLQYEFINISFSCKTPTPNLFPTIPD